MLRMSWASQTHKTSTFHTSHIIIMMNEKESSSTPSFYLFPFPLFLSPPHKWVNKQRLVFFSAALRAAEYLVIVSPRMSFLLGGAPRRRMSSHRQCQNVDFFSAALRAAAYPVIVIDINGEREKEERKNICSFPTMIRTLGEVPPPVPGGPPNKY